MNLYDDCGECFEIKVKTLQTYFQTTFRKIMEKLLRNMKQRMNL